MKRVLLIIFCIILVITTIGCTDKKDVSNVSISPTVAVVTPSPTTGVASATPNVVAITPTIRPNSSTPPPSTSKPAQPVVAKPHITMGVKTDTGEEIIPQTSVEITEGQSVLDILIKLGKETGIPVVFSSGKKNGYVEGINNLFEFDKGPESGWIYRVNGIKPSKGSSSYIVQDKDIIIWEYILKIGDLQ